MASAPSAAMIVRQRSAISATASSQPMGANRPAPLAPTRRSGRVTRSGECTRSAYARTLPQITPRVNGWAAVPVTAVTRPPAVVTSRLQADGQSCGQTERMAEDSRLPGPVMRDALRRLHPFKTPEAERLALLFAVVYFAQGMWYLPNQTITVVLKDAGFTAGGVANFFAIATTPWLIKPLYGLVSDFFPLFGRRRKSYFLLTTALAAGAGGALAVTGSHDYWTLLLLFTTMGFALAFTDVLTDASMVENGRRLGVTGAFQSVQWAAIYTASILVGEIGGRLAEGRSLSTTFALAACFPLLSLAMAATILYEPRAAADRTAVLETVTAVRQALRSREVWVVAGFIFFFTFSPSFGPGFLFYQTDRLGFSQQFIGRLAALQALGSVVGAFTYAPLSRR